MDATTQLLLTFAKAVEGSLKRLRGIDRIDVYQLHIPDPLVSFDSSVENLGPNSDARARSAWVALSNVTQEHIERARRIRSYRLCARTRYKFRRPRVGLRRGLL